MPLLPSRPLFLSIGMGHHTSTIAADVSESASAGGRGADSIDAKA
jgi:hypothetical protein